MKYTVFTNAIKDINCIRKKLYLFGATFGLFSGANAQSMNETFETYAAGSYMGLNSPAWSTWSGAVGGAEDVTVSSAQASEGTKSIYFVGSTSGGGPQDVVVEFGGPHNTGHFFFQTKIYVVNNKGAYFNFQGTTVAGQSYAINCQMVQTGALVLDDGGENSITTTYPPATWFTLTLDINLNTNEWELLIDGVSQGILQTSVNQLASIDLYPVNSQFGGNNQSGFYIDEFEFQYTAPGAAPLLNGAPIYIGNLDGIAGSTVAPSVKVRNLGTTNITSFDLEIDYNGTQITENVTGVNIAPNGIYTVDFTNTINLIAGANPVLATISNVNGSADMDATDDIKTVVIDPIVPAPGKMVVAEEGTGTWCGWCPRGAVFMDMMTETYPDHFVPIAVHNGDPMTVAAYDSGIDPYLAGYPGALVDRFPELDPSGIEVEFLERVVIAPKAVITNGAEYNSTTGLLKVSVTADFISPISGNYKLAMVITEDDVTGGSGYSQSNYYSGGGDGVMGGYELLPNPVPASQMVYDHVARIILPSFGGQPNSFPGGMSAGESATMNFELTVDSSWDLDKIHIIGLLIEPTGKINNAGSATKAEAEANGLAVGVAEAVTGKPISMYPNPTTEMTTVSVGTVHNEQVNIRIVDINGRIVAEKCYGELDGEINLPVTTSMMEAGVYMVQVTVGEAVSTSRLVVE